MSNIRMHVEDAGTVFECVVVTEAPTKTLAGAAMVRLWREGRAKHLSYFQRIDGGVVRFGRPGRGVGEVAYRIGKRVQRINPETGRLIPGEFYELIRVPA